MIGFKLTAALFISVLGIVGLNGQSTSVIDGSLFKTFCSRATTKAAFRACYHVADDAQINFFGSDMYSVASSGQILSSASSKNARTFFTISTSSDYVYVACYSSAVTLNGPVVLIYPMALDDGLLSVPKAPSSNPVGHFVSGTYKKGVTITNFANGVPMRCGWSTSPTSPLVTESYLKDNSNIGATVNLVR